MSLLEVVQTSASPIRSGDGSCLVSMTCIFNTPSFPILDGFMAWGPTKPSSSYIIDVNSVDGRSSWSDEQFIAVQSL